MVIKNNKESISNIIDWFNIEYDIFDNTPFYEQSALQLLPYFDVWCAEKINIVREEHFNEKSGQLIRHLHTGINHLRIPYFINFIEKNNLDINLIDNLIMIKYDTSLSSNLF